MIPAYLMDAYSFVPDDRPVSVLMRHSIRYPITSDDEIVTAGLTPEGVEMAKSFGDWLSTRYQIGHLASSPIQRCIDTGKWMANGARLERNVKTIHLLGHPNIHGEYDALSENLDGEPWSVHVHEVAAYLVPNGKHADGLNFFFSHDTVIVLMAAYWLGVDLRGGDVWPKFLEPFFFWWNDDKTLMAGFRQQVFPVSRIYRQWLAENIHRN